MITLKIVKFLGWALVIGGLIMRFTNTSFEGEYLDNRQGWVHSVMDGKVVIFFGLVLLGARLWLKKQLEQRNNR